MGNDTGISSLLSRTVERFMAEAAEFAPKLVVALGLLILGWIVAKVLELAFRAVLSRLKLDGFLQRAGMIDALGGTAKAPSQWVPRVLYYIVLILFVRIAADAVGLTQIADAINVLVGYVPNVAAAAIIVVAGNFFGQWLGRLVTRTADDSGVEYAKNLGRAVSALVLFLVLILALAQLKIDMRIVNAVVLVAVATFGLAFALSVGLGTRGITRDIVAGFYVRKAFRVGDEIEIDGKSGKIEAVTPVMTLLRQGNRTIAISNSALIGRSTKR